jgi:hypothetical protein
MSELKTYNSERIYWAVEQVEQEAGDIEDLHLDDNLFYIKSEADKVIAKLESEITQLSKQSSCKFSDDCLRVRQLKRELRRQKYKRCLAMARWCESEENRLEAIAPIFDTNKECWEYNSDYWYKQRERWLKIAEKIKEGDKCRG